MTAIETKRALQMIEKIEINQSFYNIEKKPVLVALIKGESFRSQLIIENVTIINAELFAFILKTASSAKIKLSYDGTMEGFDNQEMSYCVTFPWISIPFKIHGIETEIKGWHFLPIPELMEFLEKNLQ